MGIKIRKCDCMSCKGARTLEIKFHLWRIWFSFELSEWKEMPIDTIMYIDLGDSTFWLWDICYHGRGDDPRIDWDGFMPCWDIDFLHRVEKPYFEDVPGTDYVRMISKEEMLANRNIAWAKEYERRTGKRL